MMPVILQGRLFVLMVVLVFSLGINGMGIIYVILASMMLALSTVFAHIMSEGTNTILIAFYSFTFTIVLFFIIGVKSKDDFWELLRSNWFWVLFVNISTTLDWLLIFLALEYISASMINCFVFGLAPVATILLNLGMYKSHKVILQDLFICCCILLLLILLSIHYSHTVESTYKMLIGILLSCISGLATGATIYGCKKLFEKGFSANSVMKSRFVVMIISTFILLKYLDISFTLSISQSSQIIVLALCFVVIPVFLLQKGIEKVTPILTSIITALVPVMTYLFQLIEPNYVFNLYELFLIILLTIFIVYNTIVRIKE